MKHILIVLIVIASIFVSCDGRKSHSDALKYSIEKFKDSAGPIEIVEYIPQYYSEIIRDSILSNGFSVNIKTYSDMNKSVLNNHTKDTITYKKYYRDWISKITIKKANKIIFNEIIDTDFFLKNGLNLDKQIVNVISTGVWLDEEESTKTDFIYLMAEFLDVNDNSSLIYQIKIGKKGIYSFKKLDLKKEV